MSAHTEITGRDDYLIAQALYVAIKPLSALPNDNRPASLVFRNHPG